MKKMPIAIFPGTFDPITNGHVELIERAVRLFGSLIVAVAANSTKKTLFTFSKRVAMAQLSLSAMPEVRVVGFHNLMAEFAQQHQAKWLIRGIRTHNDFAYERQLAAMNHHLQADLETIFLMANEQHHFISSSIVREVASHGGDVSALVPIGVSKALRNKYKSTMPMNRDKV